MNSFGDFRCSFGNELNPTNPIRSHQIKIIALPSPHRK